MAHRIVLGLVLVLALSGCGASSGDDGGIDGGRTDAGSELDDAGGPDDAAAPTDGGGDAGDLTGADAGSPDAGSADAGSADAGSPDAGAADGGLPACHVGDLCSDTTPCGDEQRCYGFAGDGFCADFTPECGGIVMTDCAPGRVCLRGGGGSLGYCATPAEERCICDMAAARGMTVDGC